MVVAVDGTEPARVAGGRLPRLLRGGLVVIGLSALTWLVSVLIGAGTASAETPPSTQHTANTQPTGLLGGLIGTIGGVLNTATTAVGALTGAVLNTAAPVIPPVASPPPVLEAPQPQPEPVQAAKPALARSGAHVIIPVDRPAPAVAAPAHTPPAPPVVHKPAAVRAKVRVVPKVEPPAEVSEHANPSAPVRTPAKAPSAPSAPAVPTSSVSSAHDGPGGTHGVLAARAGIEPPTRTPGTRGPVRDAGETAAGLPAASPD